MGRHSAKLLYIAVIAVLLATTLKSITLKPAVASSNVCRVQLLRDGRVVQEITEPIKPTRPSTNDQRILRRYEQDLRHYEQRLSHFKQRIEQFRERVQRERRERLTMVFSENCEAFNDNSGGGGELPALESLTPGSKLYGFVSNPNVKPDGNGNYIIDFEDPNFISTPEYIGYQEEGRQPDKPPMILRLNFQNRTAFLEFGNITKMDVPSGYFQS
jgi:hypothetical protein